MRKIGTATDIGADLPKEIIDKYQISAASVKLDWPDIEDLPGENTFQKMREAEKRGIKSFGKTTQPAPKAFIDAFKKQLEMFEKVICVTITSKHSGTYNSAIQARNFLPPEQQKNVFIIDSLSASGGEALLTLRALELAEQGMEAEDIEKELEALVPKINLFLIFKDPKWMEASGRISALAATILRRMAKAGMRPLLAMKKGVLTPAGVKLKADDIPSALFRQFEDKIKKAKAQDKEISVIITHGDNPEGAHRLKKMIEDNFRGAKVEFVNIINNVVGVLTGPDSMVCTWYIK